MRGGYSVGRSHQFEGRPSGPPHQNPGGGHRRPPFDNDHHFERQDRPGYYAGNKQFRMDKLRDQPIESLHHRANDEIEKERMERQRKHMRDARNGRPPHEMYPQK